MRISIAWMHHLVESTATLWCLEWLIEIYNNIVHVNMVFRAYAVTCGWKQCRNPTLMLGNSTLLSSLESTIIN